MTSACPCADAHSIATIKVSQTDRVSREEVLTTDAPGDRAFNGCETIQERAEIPLHTNASENDLRACVTERRISGGTMSADDRQAGGVMLGLIKSCRKLGISFFAYFGNRLGLDQSSGRILFPRLVAVQPA